MSVKGKQPDMSYKGEIQTLTKLSMRHQVCPCETCRTTISESTITMLMSSIIMKTLSGIAHKPRSPLLELKCILYSMPQTSFHSLISQEKKRLGSRILLLWYFSNDSWFRVHIHVISWDPYTIATCPTLYHTVLICITGLSCD